MPGALGSEPRSLLLGSRTPRLVTRNYRSYSLSRSLTLGQSDSFLISSVRNYSKDDGHFSEELPERSRSQTLGVSVKAPIHVQTCGNALRTMGLSLSKFHDRYCTPTNSETAEPIACCDALLFRRVWGDFGKAARERILSFRCLKDQCEFFRPTV